MGCLRSGVTRVERLSRQVPGCGARCQGGGRGEGIESRRFDSRRRSVVSWPDPQVKTTPMPSDSMLKPLTGTTSDQLETHLREIIRWHFSPETGCPFWLDWAKKAGWYPVKEVNSLADLVAKFPHFQDEWLRDLQPEVWVPMNYRGRPFNIFETGGTTGMPKQRIGWDDYKTDYEEFSAKISDDHFPRGGAWLMLGPPRPRRLRLAIEHLANYRGSSCYFVDLDPRWVKKVIAEKKAGVARAYMDHVVEQAVTILKHPKIHRRFHTRK